MSTPFQNRLVGTVIVLAVAIIFLPDVLDGEKQTYQSDFEDIPKAPSFEGSHQSKSFPQEKLAALPKQTIVDEVAVDEQEQANVEKNTSSAKVINQDTSKVKVTPLNKPQAFDESKTNEQPKKQVETKAKSLPEKAVPSQAWVIQLGSFKHKKNVDILVNKLKANGYTAFTKPIKTKNGTLTKVFVGPELIKSSLEKKISKLKALTNVEGKLARFYPTR